MIFWTLLIIGFQVSMMAWPVLALLKMFSVRGTRQRWILSSFERVFRYPNIIAQLILMGLSSQDGDWLSVGMCCISVGAALFIIHHYFGDDEDDFWTGFTRRVREGVAHAFQNLSPATGSIHRLAA